MATAVVVAVGSCASYRAEEAGARLPLDDGEHGGRAHCGTRRHEAASRQRRHSARSALLRVLVVNV